MTEGQQERLINRTLQLNGEVLGGVTRLVIDCNAQGGRLRMEFNNSEAHEYPLHREWLGAFLISAPNMEFSFTSREQAPPTLEQTEELIPQEITANHEEDIAVVAGAVPLSKHKPRLKKVKH